MSKEVKRLISASYSDFKQWSPMDLKEAIRKSEGRVVVGQHLLFDGKGLVRGVTNTELMCAFGADMVMLNTYNFNNANQNLGMQGLTVKELKERCRRPVGIYLGCPGKNKPSDSNLYDSDGMLATPEHVEKAVESGADFLVLGGNPGSGTSLRDVIETTKWIKDQYGDRVFLWAGKWEDGVTEKVLGDPMADYDAKAVIRELIDNGADVIDLPAPGARSGISVSMIQELVQYAHSYSRDVLTMSFLNSSLEGADTGTVRQIALMMKETGADIMCIGDGGFAGCTSPENIMQLSFSVKGKPYTYFRMASVNI